MADNWNKLVYYYLAAATTCLLYLNPCQCIFIEVPRNVTYLPGLTPLPIELTCNVINGFPIWQVNGTSYRVDQLDNGELLGHSHNGLNILVDSPMNNTEYICVFQTINGSILLSDPAYIIIAGVPAMVPGVTVTKSTTNGNNVILTLSWGEPFNNLDPIVSYTVSCSGDDTCPPNFTTTDNTTRNFAIPSLIPLTNYTFSVVATNYIGSGPAGVVMITTPSGISRVNGIELQCDLVNIISQCSITWSWNSLLENVTNFLIISNVGRFNVSSQNTSHTFTVLSLPGGASSGEVTVTVIAVNELGQGPPSEVARANITVPSVINATPMLVCTPAVSELYNITVTCTIHPDSTADQCVVMAMADGRVTRTGNASITEGMATVTISDLRCGVTYNITAEGVLNETLVGSRSSHGNITPRPCPMISTVDKSDDELSTGAAIAITFVITFIITLVVAVLISVFITSLYYKRLILKSAINQSDSHSLTKDVKRTDPTYAAGSANITMDTNPAYGTNTTIKMDTNPAYATTSH